MWGPVTPEQVIKISSITIFKFIYIILCPYFRGRHVPSREWRLWAGVWNQTGICPLLLSVTLHPITWRKRLFPCWCFKWDSRWLFSLRPTSVDTVWKSANKRSCVHVMCVFYCTETGDDGVPRHLTPDNEKSDFHSDVGSEPSFFTDKMISGNSLSLKAKFVVSNIQYLILCKWNVSKYLLPCQTRLSVCHCAAMPTHSACWKPVTQPVYVMKVSQVMDSCV